MTDRGIDIVQKRRNLRNLLDQAEAKQKDLNHLNRMIERETRELQLLETTLKVDRTVDELNNYPKDAIELNGEISDPKRWSWDRLKVYLYNSGINFSDEE